MCGSSTPRCGQPTFYCGPTRSPLPIAPTLVGRRLASLHMRLIIGTSEQCHGQGCCGCQPGACSIEQMQQKQTCGGLRGLFQKVTLPYLYSPGQQQDGDVEAARYVKGAGWHTTLRTLHTELRNVAGGWQLAAIRLAGYVGSQPRRCCSVPLFEVLCLSTRQPGGTLHPVFSRGFALRGVSHGTQVDCIDQRNRLVLSPLG